MLIRMRDKVFMLPRHRKEDDHTAKFGPVSRLIVGACVALASVCAPAKPRVEVELVMHGVRLGSSILVEDLERRVPGIRCFTFEPGVYDICTLASTSGGDGLFAISLLKGKVAAISAEFPATEFDVFSESLIRELGRPKRVDTIFRDGDVELDQVELRWRDNDGARVFAIKRVVDNPSMGGLLGNTREFDEYQDARDVGRRMTPERCLALPPACPPA